MSQFKHKSRKPRFDERKKRQFLAVFIVGLMGFSAIAFIGNYIGQNNDSGNYAAETQEYNGFEFTKYSYLWEIQLEGKQYGFEYFPTELEFIEVPQTVPFRLAEQERIYLAADPLSELDFSTAVQTAAYYGAVHSVRMAAACTKEQGCPDIPLVNCEENQATIVFEESTTQTISVNKSCIVLSAPNAAQGQQLIERLITHELGIISS